MRLIDADRLLDRCKFYHLPNGDLAVPIIDVQHAPTIEPERKGEWIPNQENGTFKIYTCSNCGWNSEAEFNFCPNCGADMRKPKLRYGDEDTLQGGLMSAT